jgi:hypothetical protein
MGVRGSSGCATASSPGALLRELLRGVDGQASAS